MVSPELCSAKPCALGFTPQELLRLLGREAGAAPLKPMETSPRRRAGDLGCINEKDKGNKDIFVLVLVFYSCLH